MTMRVVGSLLCLALLGACSNWPRQRFCFTVPSPMSERRAYRLIKTAPRVWPDGWGIAGAPSCYAAAYRVLLTSPDASSQFSRLFETGTPAGKLYALAGLQQTKSPLFDRYSHSTFAESKAPVEVFEGCVIREQPIATIVARLLSGDLYGF